MANRTALPIHRPLVNTLSNIADQHHDGEGHSVHYSAKRKRNDEIIITEKVVYDWDHSGRSAKLKEIRMEGITRATRTAPPPPSWSDVCKPTTTPTPSNVPFKGIESTVGVSQGVLEYNHGYSSESESLLMLPVKLEAPSDIAGCSNIRFEEMNVSDSSPGESYLKNPFFRSTKKNISDTSDSNGVKEIQNTDLKRERIILVPQRNVKSKESTQTPILLPEIIHLETVTQCPSASVEKDFVKEVVSFDRRVCENVLSFSPSSGSANPFSTQLPDDNISRATVITVNKQPAKFLGKNGEKLNVNDHPTVKVAKRDLSINEKPEFGENTIGTKLSKRRVSVPSCLYAKPKKVNKTKFGAVSICNRDLGQQKLDSESDFTAVIPILGNINTTEAESNFNDINESDALNKDQTSSKVWLTKDELLTTASYSPLNKDLKNSEKEAEAEGITVEVSPYSILFREEEVPKMTDVMSHPKYCSNNFFPVISVRNDIWELDVPEGSNMNKVSSVNAPGNTEEGSEVATSVNNPPIQSTPAYTTQSPATVVQITTQAICNSDNTNPTSFDEKTSLPFSICQVQEFNIETLRLLMNDLSRITTFKSLEDFKFQFQAILKSIERVGTSKDIHELTDLYLMFRPVSVSMENTRKEFSQTEKTAVGIVRLVKENIFGFIDVVTQQRISSMGLKLQCSSDWNKSSSGTKISLRKTAQYSLYLIYFQHMNEGCMYTDINVLILFYISVLTNILATSFSNFETKSIPTLKQLIKEYEEEFVVPFYVIWDENEVNEIIGRVRKETPMNKQEFLEMTAEYSTDFLRNEIESFMRMTVDKWIGDALDENHSDSRVNDPNNEPNILISSNVIPTSAKNAEISTLIQNSGIADLARKMVSDLQLNSQQ